MNPAFEEVENCVLRGSGGYGEPVHTITIYMNAARSMPLIDEILAANPQRIIMNPGPRTRNWRRPPAVLGSKS